ncbi:MAG: 2-oxoglutarate dehydrogenase, partial [Clostridia bacterium]|nr:2-oxoglutarate dehydrogenase [Clostridia bacterium]
MFGRRSDGTPVKDMDIIERLTSHFMPDRNDAMNMIMNQIRCEKIDEFIARKREEGIKYTYMDIINASIVRILALRPMLNRFVMRG